MTVRSDIGTSFGARLYSKMLCDKRIAPKSYERTKERKLKVLGRQDKGRS